jgi:predicted dehydrogenase
MLKVGIAGYGVVGKRRHQYIDIHPSMKVIAVCDQTFTETHTTASGLKVYQNYLDLLKEPIDILFVCLPNDIAPIVTIAGLEKNMHVFCEKPPGRNVADIQMVIEVEKKYPHLKLKYGFNHRYHDSVRMALDVIKSGELGHVINIRGVYGKSRIISFEGGWRSDRNSAGGGILLDQGIHMVDLMRLFCGDFVEIKSYVDNSYWNHDIEDNAYAIMKDSKGRIAMLHSTATQWQHRFHMDIALSEGYIELHGILSGSKSYGEEKIIIGKRDDESMNGQMESKTINFLTDNSWKDEIFDFADAIVNNTPIVSGTSHDGLEIMKLVYGIYYNDKDWREKYSISNPNI